MPSPVDFPRSTRAEALRRDAADRTSGPLRTRHWAAATPLGPLPFLHFRHVLNATSPGTSVFDIVAAVPRGAAFHVGVGATPHGMKPFPADRLLPAGDIESIEAAVVCLANGGLVALPTETVYGLGADATRGEAVARIFEAKGRPRFNPLIVHVADPEMARRIACFDDLALRLCARFWPGPLTLVLPARPDSPVHPLASAGLATIAVRMPRGVMCDIAGRVGVPIAAPSANRSGRVSPTTAAHVAASLGDGVDLILDGGPAAVGLESTILKPVDGRLHLLRAGGLDPAEIEAATGLAVWRSAPGPAIEAPGQLVSHYAPAGAVRLGATSVDPGEALVTFGGRVVTGADAASIVLDLSPDGSLREAAARLFAVLAELDRPDIARIAVVPIPTDGLGEAINDRLARAAAPRPA